MARVVTEFRILRELRKLDVNTNLESQRALAP